MRAVDRLISNCNSILNVMKSWASETASDVTFSWTNADGTVSSHTFANAKKLNVDNSEHNSSISNPHAVSKSQVGLGNVDNTSDINKPISSAQQNALDNKADTAHNHSLSQLAEKDYESLDNKPSLESLHDHDNKEYLDKFGEDSDGNLTYNGVVADTTIAQRDVYDGVDSDDNTISLSARIGKYLYELIGSKEDSFYKNTAFNKSFGTGDTDVATGSHGHTLSSLDEKSYSSLDDTPDLSAMHDHGNMSTLDRISYSTTSEDYELDGSIISRIKIFDNDDDLADYVPVKKYELSYSANRKVLCTYSDSDQKWFEIGKGSPVTKYGQGAGEAGTYINSWEDVDDIDTNYVSERWGDTVDGAENGKWNRHSGSTGSSGTGPTSAQDGTYYVYAEVSSNGHLEDYRLTTNNFKIATEIKMAYHMYGDNIGTMEIITTTSGVDTVRWSISGDQGDQWRFITVDLTGFDAEYISIRYHDATGYAGDAAIDDIQITSVDEE